ncbi:hypothetical protein, partial [Bacillus sp. SIMBA_005]|uniref:hypothetical protein n=1 Tax=Bacillus sp. SIMBA_005 TaxID=3085754 RepID=UPI00397B4027
MSDAQGSKNDGEYDAEHLDSAPEAGAPSDENAAPAVDFGDAPRAEGDRDEAVVGAPEPVVEAEAPLDEAPSAFLA